MNAPGRRLASGVAVAAALTSTLVACGGGATHAAVKSPSTSAAGAVATRWWSNSAAAAGSVISAAQPSSAAAKLHPSQSEYCQMLRQTVALGKSILPGVTATDPVLVASTEAFIAELQSVAPPSVTEQWQVVGNAIVQLVKSAGKPGATTGVSNQTVSADVQAISTDAKAACHLDLTKK